MDLKDPPALATFRQELRTWLLARLPPGWEGREPVDPTARFVLRRTWQRALWEGGWCGLTWPREYGGRGLSYLEQIVFYEELARARAPRLANYIGVELVGPTILAHGTEAQKRRYLAPILSAEEIWCQLFSEPEAGSDLAALQTRAVRDGDEFVITGQKVWTSQAHHADMGLLLARTEPGATRHLGITCLLVPMRAAGVTVRPLRQLTGEAEFNEVFFDEVRVPVANVLGDVGRGWPVALTALACERGTLMLSRNVDVAIAFGRLMTLARALRRGRQSVLDDPLIRDDLTRLYTRVLALRYLGYRIVSEHGGSRLPPAWASLIKLRWSEVNQTLYELGLRLQGARGQLLAGSAHALEDGAWQRDFLYSRSNTIAAGTSEIQRNIIAERLLGLPRSCR